MDLFKKAKELLKPRKPDPSTLDDIPERDPHEEFRRKDLLFKRRRGGHM